MKICFCLKVIHKMCRNTMLSTNFQIFSLLCSMSALDLWLLGNLASAATPQVRKYLAMLDLTSAVQGHMFHQ